MNVLEPAEGGIAPDRPGGEYTVVKRQGDTIVYQEGRGEKEQGKREKTEQEDQQERQAMKRLFGTDRLDMGVVPKTSDEAIAAISQWKNSSAHKHDFKLVKNEETPFQDEWGSESEPLVAPSSKPSSKL